MGVLWESGAGSLVDDVRFLGGHGSGINPYNNNPTADPDSRKRWDGQYPSLWVTHGGGGSFADIWTPDTFAQAGFYVSDTKTPGHVYELSNEHHVRNEIKFDHVENWDINAPQTEEEAGESPESLVAGVRLVEEHHRRQLSRLSRDAFPRALSLPPCASTIPRNIHFRNVHVNAESGYAVCDGNGCGTFLRVSKFPYENAIEDMTHHLEVREREFAVLDVPADPQTPLLGDASAVLAPGAQGREARRRLLLHLRRSGGRCGKLYFVDRHQQRIYGWSQHRGSPSSGTIRSIR